MGGSWLCTTEADTKIILTSLIVVYEINADLCGLSFQRLICSPVLSAALLSFEQ